MNRQDAPPRRLVGVGAAAVLMAAGAVLACDIPIYKVAVQQWPREPYALFYCTQKGLKANARLDGILDKAFRTWLKSVNLDLIRIDVKRPMLEEDRELMERRGIHPLPYAVLTDADGRKVIDHSDRLDQAAWRKFTAAASPAGPFKVLVFTAGTRWQPKVQVPKDLPFPAQVIELDRADTPTRALAKRLGVNEFRLPHALLLDREGAVLRSRVGRLDAKAWQAFRDATTPRGPCRVVVFTKTELGSPLPDPAAKTPLPVTVVDLDREDGPGRELARKLNVVNLPFLTIVSPRGTELANFGRDLDEKHLRAVVSSPIRARIIKELKGKIATLLFVHSNDPKRDRQAMKVIKKGISRGRRLFEGRIGLVEIDPRDRNEEYLFRNLRLARDGKEPLVLAVFGKGKVLAVPPLKGKFSSDDVLDVVQIVMQGCSCVIQPSDLGEDLLLDWPEPEGQGND